VMSVGSARSRRILVCGFCGAIIAVSVAFMAVIFH
jgi:hypothetical protein